MNSVSSWSDVVDAIQMIANGERASSFFVEIGNYQHVPCGELEALASRMARGRIVYADQLQSEENRPYRWQLPGRATFVVVTPEWNTLEVPSFPRISWEDRAEAVAMVERWVSAAKLSDALDDGASFRVVAQRDLGEDWNAPWLARLRQILAFPTLDAVAGEATEEFLRVLDENVVSGDSRVVFIALSRRHQELPEHGLHQVIRENATQNGRAFYVDERAWQGLVRDEDDSGLIAFS